MYTDYKEFGKRIAKRRRQLGLSQTKVNEMAGLSDKYLSNIERAVSIPSIDVLMKICAVLKTTPDELLLGTEKSGNIGNVGRIAAMKTEALPREKQLLALSLLDLLNEQKI
ncbi:MAG: helix-turn-helix transcriptional regulator [Ruminiclostridium sp.]|nr:helix-turn-helix transcriptional regulator [Ruminiclostridium sp.]